MVEHCSVGKSQTSDIVPFLKWAGGKRWLNSYENEVAPQGYNRYIEPFLGSGALFFRLQPSRSILGDVNTDLIQVYSAIKSDWPKVERELQRLQKLHDSEFYYTERARNRRMPHTKAARFIYLNRTCWNGLYRVNLKGEFNVPIGTKTAVCMPTDNFAQVAELLNSTLLRNQDFSNTISQAREGDFLFVDPPYTVKHNMNGFVKYNEKIFSWDDQIRLRNCLVRASQRGVLVTITNADHTCIKDLYSGFGTMSSLGRHSVLAGKSLARTKTSELLIKNW